MSVFKDILKITVITIVAGAILGLVFQVTKAPIAEAKATAQQEAYKAVFTEADSFKALDSFDETAVNKYLEDNGFEDDSISLIVQAFDSSDQLIGYVLNVTSSVGYGGDVTFSMGIKMDGTLNGYEMVEIAETAGLGMKATETKFKSQFENKTETNYTVTKATATSDNEIEAISGATITSKAVTGAVNAGLSYFYNNLQGGN